MLPSLSLWMSRPGRAARVAAGLAFGAALAMPASAAVDAAELKAAIVYNLLQFVQWPPDVGIEPVVLCVDTASPVALPLRALNGRPVQQQRLEVLELGPQEAVRRCHALFIDAASRGGRRAAPGQPLLVIADEGGTAEAAAVRLWQVDGRMRFEVDLAVARLARLQLSARLLRLAHRVSE